MSRNFKKIAVASALVAATTLPTTMVSALETNVKNDSNTPVTLSSERRGWYEEYGYKYYYDDNGELLKGLQEIDGNTYYFYSYDGHMAYSSWYDEDTITDNGLIVTVNKSGIVTNYANIVAGDWTHYGDRWYYYDADMNPYIGVKTINGVKYYNDAIATIPEATINCVEALKDVDTIIFGGMDRGIDYNDLIDFFNKSKIKNFICMPDTGYKIGKEIKSKNVYMVETLEDAVKKAKEVTKNICVMSPAASSYNAFKNFEEKGRIYKELVNDKN